MTYYFSRAIYRDLAPYIREERPSWQTESNRELVLRACEDAMNRLVCDHRYFARPTRALFKEIRTYFSMADQLRVYTVVERNLSMALRLLSRFPEQVLEANGVVRQCQAMTRKGRPCQRRPLPRSDYCPSHQHLTEDFAELGEVELAA